MRHMSCHDRYISEWSRPSEIISGELYLGYVAWKVEKRRFPLSSASAALGRSMPKEV